MNLGSKVNSTTSLTSVMSGICSETREDSKVVYLTEFLVRVQVEASQDLDGRVVDHFADDLDKSPHQLVVLSNLRTMSWFSDETQNQTNLCHCYVDLPSITGLDEGTICMSLTSGLRKAEIRQVTCNSR